MPSRRDNRALPSGVKPSLYYLESTPAQRQKVDLLSDIQRACAPASRSRSPDDGLAHLRLALEASLYQYEVRDRHPLDARAAYVTS